MSARAFPGWPRLSMRLTMGAGVVLTGLGLDAAGATDCPATGYDEAAKRIAAAPSCDASMDLLMACQLGSSGDVALSEIVIRTCERDFLAKLGAGGRARYARQRSACGSRLADVSGTLSQSVRAICAAEVAQGFADRARRR